eukprot:m.310634 g.310634  ORF g.310634 m.310634 type:complete len:195 (-) comp16478_c0_seq16:1363-1947(-)
MGESSAEEMMGLGDPMTYIHRSRRSKNTVNVKTENPKLLQPAFVAMKDLDRTPPRSKAKYSKRRADKAPASRIGIIQPPQQDTDSNLCNGTSLFSSQSSCGKDSPAICKSLTYEADDEEVEDGEAEINSSNATTYFMNADIRTKKGQEILIDCLKLLKDMACLPVENSYQTWKAGVVRKVYDCAAHCPNSVSAL